MVKYLAKQHNLLAAVIVSLVMLFALLTSTGVLRAMPFQSTGATPLASQSDHELTSLPQVAIAARQTPNPPAALQLDPIRTTHAYTAYLPLIAKTDLQLYGSVTFHGVPISDVAITLYRCCIFVRPAGWTQIQVKHANVQPHSGSQANMAVYLTVLQPGDVVLCLDLAHGGHLTHGMKLNISGRLYNFINYGVTRDTHRIDFDQVASQARQHKPKLIVAGASAYPREIPHGKFAEIAAEVGTKLFVDMAHYAGLVAAGLHDNPVPVADFVTTTTTRRCAGPGPG